MLVLSVCMLSACDPYERAIKYYDKQDYVRAAEYFKKLADEGNAEAMAWLGLCIDRGGCGTCRFCKSMVY